MLVSVESLIRAAAVRLTGEGVGSFRTSVNRNVGRTLLNIVCQQWTMWCFCFAGVPFNLHSWGETFRLWAALGYYGVWLMGLPALGACCVLIAVGPKSRLLGGRTV